MNWTALATAQAAAPRRRAENCIVSVGNEVVIIEVWCVVVVD